MAALAARANSLGRVEMARGRTAWPGSLFLSELTEWMKIPHQLCAEIYPNPTDGLPPEVLSRAVPCADGVDMQDEGKERGA